MEIIPDSDSGSGILLNLKALYYERSLLMINGSTDNNTTKINTINILPILPGSDKSLSRIISIVLFKFTIIIYNKNYAPSQEHNLNPVLFIKKIPSPMNLKSALWESSSSPVEYM